MKVKLLAGLIGACLATPVLAQSNVIIYGIVDTGIIFESNVSSAKGANGLSSANGGQIQR